MSAVVQLQSSVASPPVVTAASDLLALARSRKTPDRERLLLGIAALCEAAPPVDGQASPVLTEIFMVLAGQAESEIRKVLAETLARAAWAPPALINMLALDDIEIARPIIASSPLLRDQDLLRILIEASIEHQIEVARRSRLGGRVADAIIDRAEPAVLTALAGNRSAEIGEAGVRALVEHSRRIAALRAPLVRHPRLTAQLAEQLHGWVGLALRQAISERFNVDDNALDDAVTAAVNAANTGKRIQQAAAPASPNERDEMDRRLVAKLAASAQLRPGYLIRAVREGRLGLFEHGLATLAEFPITQVRAAVRSLSPEPLCLACAAVGIDRAVFPALVEEIRSLSGGYPSGGDPRATRSPRSAEAAAREFRAAMSGY